MKLEINVRLYDNEGEIIDVHSWIIKHQVDICDVMDYLYGYIKDEHKDFDIINCDVHSTSISTKGFIILTTKYPGKFFDVSPIVYADDYKFIVKIDFSDAYVDTYVRP